MEEQRTEQAKSHEAVKLLTYSLTGSFWQDEKLTCSQCKFGDQDIDTYPCAKCHTRH